MVEPVTKVSAVVNLLDRTKSVIDKFGPTRLSIVGIDQEWFGGQLIHRYRFRITKPKYSKSASKSPIQLNIPKNLGIAEFDLDLPGIQIEPITIPASKLNVTSYELISGCLEKLHDGQEILMNLRILCPWEEVLKSSESRQRDRITYSILNPNNFPVKSCDIERTILLTNRIREIEIVKQGTVISQRLIKLSKTYSVDFEASKFQIYFPGGISASDDAWFKEKDRADSNCIANRAESNCILRFTLDLDAHDEIEIRLNLS